LLKEIHHRVKNNLSVISSLLHLQSGYIEDKQVREMFKESQNRILSMARIHQKLYSSQDMTNINFKHYIEEIISEMTQSYSISNRISTHLEIKDCELNIEQAIPCGLLLNELITNSMKYAFPDDVLGKIRIFFKLRQDEYYELNYKDDGIGLPTNIDIEQSETLGLKLINILTQQLHGSLKIRRANGTSFEIVFPVLKK